MSKNKNLSLPNFGDTVPVVLGAVYVRQSDPKALGVDVAIPRSANVAARDSFERERQIALRQLSKLSELMKKLGIYDEFFAQLSRMTESVERVTEKSR